MNYYEDLNKEIKRYFYVLSPEIPKFLNEYIDTPTLSSKVCNFF